MRVRDLCYINRKNLNANIEFDSYLYLDTGNITKNLIDNVQIFKNRAELPSRAKRMVSPGDIIISTVRPIQKHYGILEKPEDNLLVSTGFTVLTPKKEIVNGHYLYYYLTQEKITNYFQMIAESSVSSYPSITPDIIGNVEIELPPIDEQNRVANIIKNVDVKICINLELISFLEEYSKLLFHKWFVDFNFPNEEGKPYKDNGGEMYEVDGEMIPVGWSRIKLGEIVSLKNGLNYAANGEEEPNAKIISVKHLNNNFILNDFIADDFYLEERADDDFFIRKYDTIIARSASPGESAISLSDLDVYYAGFSIRMRPISEEYRYYVFFNSIRLKKMITSNADGTIIKNITQQSLNNFKSIISDKIVLEEFNKVIEPILLKIKLLQQENQLFEETRDLLIKKLIK